METDNREPHPEAGMLPIAWMVSTVSTYIIGLSVFLRSDARP